MGGPHRAGPNFGIQIPYILYIIATYCINYVRAKAIGFTGQLVRKEADYIACTRPVSHRKGKPYRASVI